MWTNKQMIVTLLACFVIFSDLAFPTRIPSKNVLYAAQYQADKPSDKKISNHKSSVKRTKKRSPKKRAQDMSWVKLVNRFPETFMLNGPRENKVIALTFDDAPDPRFTPAILDILAKYNICATFFLVGDRAAKHPDLVNRILREGHVIGNHSYDHALFSQLSFSQFQKEIWRTDAIIKNIAGVSPRFMRPPYGELLSQQVAWGKNNGFTIVNWDVDSEDWKKNPSSSRVLSNIKKTLQPGSIVLQHAGGGEGQDLIGTVKALPILIEQLQGKGYKLVTLPEMLGKKAYR